MMRGEIDFLYEVRQELASSLRRKRDTGVPFLRNYVYTVVFNSRREVRRSGKFSSA